jgi:hypothetical protein
MERGFVRVVSLMAMLLAAMVPALATAHSRTFPATPAVSGFPS